MNVAILHYHLNRGGVTQVIANHLRALQSSCQDPLRVALVSGGRRSGWDESLLKDLPRLDVVHVDVPAIDYDDDRPFDPPALAQQLARGLSRHQFSPDDTIIHAHNHALGKNVSLPGALALLADQGFALLLQIHDFAEDFRPALYQRLSDAIADNADALSEVLYPQASRIHYAVLNHRDQSVLQAAGVEADRLHVLPNPVAEFGDLPERQPLRTRLQETLEIPPEQSWVLYPVRGIGRKNVGELLLWSALFQGRAHFGLTLPPINPQERQKYDHWKRVSAELRLPCVFEAGEASGLSFLENLAAADRIINTSLAEGFGMVFLESWLAGRYLIGRDLPEITADFVEAGVRFDHLRPTLLIPLDWVGKHSFVEMIRAAYLRVLAAYRQCEPSNEELTQEIESLTSDGCVDFGLLDVVLQEQVIRHVHGDSLACERVVELNPWIDQAMATGSEELEATIEVNAATIREQYSLGACGKRLANLYRDVVQSDRNASSSQSTPMRQVLDQFIRLSRFRPIRGS